jgi:hypothetical protein
MAGIPHGMVIAEARRALARRPPARCACENRGAGDPTLHADGCPVAVAMDLAMDEALDRLYAELDESIEPEADREEAQDEFE